MEALVILLEKYEGKPCEILGDPKVAIYSHQCGENGVSLYIAGARTEDP